MALQKDITDIKGVKTRYHAIRTFTCDEKEIAITIRSYTTKATRDAEKQALINNERAMAYNEAIQSHQDELNEIIGNPDEKDRAEELTELINNMVFDENRPKLVTVEERFYSETNAKMPYFDPLSFEAIYDKLAQDEKSPFFGGTKI